MAFAYGKLKPIGQNDDMSCWAAGLSWWLKANNRPISSQNDLIVEFSSLTDDSGGLSPDNMIKVLATPRFNMSTASFDLDGISQIRDTGLLPLVGGDSPNIVCFQRFLVGPGIIGLHMNVIFNQQGEEGAKSVMCMEPDYPDGASNAKRTGGYVSKSISEFLRRSPLIIGYPS